MSSENTTSSRGLDPSRQSSFFGGKTITSPRTIQERQPERAQAPECWQAGGATLDWVQVKVDQHREGGRRMFVVIAMVTNRAKTIPCQRPFLPVTLDAVVSVYLWTTSHEDCSIVFNPDQWRRQERP